MKNTYLISFFLIGVLGFPAAASDQPAPRSQAARFGLYLAERNLYEAGFLLRMKEKISLTQDQEKSIRGMMLKYEERAINRNADIKAQEMKLVALLRQDPVNRKEMEKLFRHINRLRTDLYIDHLNYLLDLRALLTAEQKELIEEGKRNFRQRMLQRRKETGKD